MYQRRFHPLALLILSLNFVILPLCSGPAAAQNRVLQLDGDGDYVRLPSHVFDPLEEATVEAWVKWEGLGYFSQFFAFGSGKTWQAMGLNHWETSPTLQFFIYTLSSFRLRICCMVR